MEINKRNELIYKIARFWLLFVFVGAIIDAFVISIFTMSIGIAPYQSWSLIYSVVLQIRESAELDMSYFYFGTVAMVLIAVPYLLCFIFSRKKYVWYIIGFILYAFDTTNLLFSLLYTLTEGELLKGEMLHDIVSLVIHAVGMPLLIFGLILGKRLSRFANTGRRRIRGGPFGYYDSSFTNVRTLCLTRVNNYICQNISFYYSVNGSEMQVIRPGETKIIMVDGNYQRLAVLIPGNPPTEAVVPAGTQNVSFAVNGNYIDGSLRLYIQKLN